MNNRPALIVGNLSYPFHLIEPVDQLRLLALAKLLVVQDLQQNVFSFVSRLK